jgi:hypothetical protein
MCALSLWLAACDSPDERCQQAVGCEIDGLCAHHDVDGCVAGEEEHCARSQACRVHGRCTLLGNKCDVVTDADCKASEVCKEDGSCQRIIRWDGTAACVPPCDRREPCRAVGYCQRKGERCLPGSDADCAQSLACKLKGRCVVGGDGRCDLPD